MPKLSKIYQGQQIPISGTVYVTTGDSFTNPASLITTPTTKTEKK